ncbi:MAG: SDR family NAD(P)-dependent oxidoreductase, partial [Pseudomonadota bacterium]
MPESTTGRLSGKSAIITGGAAGIGRASSLMFAKEGARVVILDINAEAARETVGMIEGQGGRAHFIEADVSKS